MIIEDDCWTGINSVITKGVRLKGSIIGANSVVTKDTEENSINVGSPSIKLNLGIDIFNMKVGIIVFADFHLKD